MMSSMWEKWKLRSYVERCFDPGLKVDIMLCRTKIASHFKDSIFIVTGANSSIGRFIVNYLKNKGAIVIRIVKSSKTLSEDKYQCDLSDPNQVLDFCEKFREKHSKLNGIINLASGMYETYETNDLGIEKTFAANVLAPYLLFKNLSSLIESSGGKRILNVINPLALTVKMNPKDLNSKATYYARDAFLQCERYRIELWHHLAEEYPNIRFHCMIPGFVRTDGLKKKFPLFYYKYTRSIFTLRNFREDRMAAILILWCLVTPKISSIPNGSLIFDRIVQKEYIIKKHKTSIEDHKMFISNFYEIVESNVKN